MISKTTQKSRARPPLRRCCAKTLLGHDCTNAAKPGLSRCGVHLRTKANQEEGGNAKPPALLRGRVSADTAAWERVKPKRGKERRDLWERCGDRCFLVPEGYKYPVCALSSRECRVDCRAVRAGLGNAAKTRKNPAVSRDAREVAVRAGKRASQLGEKYCQWQYGNE